MRRPSQRATLDPPAIDFRDPNDTAEHYRDDPPPRSEKKKLHHVVRARKHLHPARVHEVTAPRVALCPLTGLPAPGGHVPHRAAVAVKVENLPEARPQYGLDKADIVFEEPVEGG